MTTRRNLLAGIAAAPVALAMPSMARGDDAELLAAYAEFNAHDRASIKRQVTNNRTQAQADADDARYSELQNRVCEFKAKTPAGLAVMALMAIRFTGQFDMIVDAIKWDGYTRPDDDDMDYHQELLWNIVESAVEMSGRAIV
ncbi:MAG: hypothetical protein WCJ64_02140 [Rhodospirillaceae bacterium]